MIKKQIDETVAQIGKDMNIEVRVEEEVKQEAYQRFKIEPAVILPKA